MNIPAGTKTSRLRELQIEIGCELPAINRAILESHHKIEEFHTVLLGRESRPVAEDSSLVFFGSLARQEWTLQSDADWVLLIDGQVSGQHFAAFQNIREQFREIQAKKPGATKTFDELAFSHELVHQIGGHDDTNRNLTLRMLLLLESLSIGSDAVRQRVIKSVLSRYLADDPSWTWRSDAELPRFLLNDVVRFWRTMAVDFADKFHDQEGEKWALRNTKLRFSRKLLFLTGLLACFSWKIRPPAPHAKNSEHAIDIAIQHFGQYLSRTPLEIVADELLLTGASKQVKIDVLTSYDQFLAILDDPSAREELENLPRDIAEKSSLFQRIREISHVFQNALLEWLFKPDTVVFALVRKYGLF